MISKIKNRALDKASGASALRHIALSDDALAVVVGGRRQPDAPTDSEPPPPAVIDSPAFGDLYAGLLAIAAESEKAAAEAAAKK